MLINNPTETQRSNQIIHFPLRRRRLHFGRMLKILLPSFLRPSTGPVNVTVTPPSFSTPLLPLQTRKTIDEKANKPPIAMVAAVAHPTTEAPRTKAAGIIMGLKMSRRGELRRRIATDARNENSIMARSCPPIAMPATEA